MFDIYLTDTYVPELESDVQALYGRICIDKFSETFTASLVHWSPAQYEQHWEKALKRVVEDRNNSALITSYVTPDLEKFLIWWPVYLEGDAVYIQNELLIYSQLSEPFSIERPWDSLRPRQSTDPEGNSISEWSTTLESLQECLDRLRERNKSQGDVAPERLPASSKSSN